jgi:hypothetical protein
MDSRLELGEGASGRQRYWTVEEKWRIVEQPAETGLEEATSPASGVTINIEFPGRTLVSVEGSVDPISGSPKRSGLISVFVYFSDEVLSRG